MPILKSHFYTNRNKTRKGVFRAQLNIYDETFLQSKLMALSFIIDVRAGSKHVSDKDRKYALNFKLTQICVSIRTFYYQKIRAP